MRGFKLYPTLIEAVAERWRPETHTFHFPSGEVTITLEDVAYQLDVPVNGALVNHNMNDPTSLVYQVFGKWPPSDVINGFRVRIIWLESKFHVTDESTEEEIIFMSQAYFLQLIGAVLLLDKSGNLVQTQYLRYLEDFTVCRNTNWGLAILAFLYRELCKAVIIQLGRKVDVVDCLILLQWWVWYRFPFMSPLTTTPIEFPLAAR
ncbi:protein MAINTENANCE OF MERISTEMS-like [Hibiscus syriacus]|uniref:protein MAINTENANCE OF MERISTEMS-like n=1 Tax=Hibiscus syriacus TaxID=106335 RepID=UPI0019211F21|nr:protein MAINTENANCE OF MERISTEMS-like [Hibiscus syriacus]